MDVDMSAVRVLPSGVFDVVKRNRKITNKAETSASIPPKRLGTKEPMAKPTTPATSNTILAVRGTRNSLLTSFDHTARGYFSGIHSS